MEGIFSAVGLGPSNKNSSVKVNVTPSPAAITSTGKTLKNAVANAKSVANALNVVSKQLSDASLNLKNKAPVIANVAADAVKANAPGAAEALKPVVGGANAALISNMPKSLIVGGARNVVEEVARQIKKLSGAARDASDAIVEGVKNVGKAATYVANNVKKVDPKKVNSAVGGATNAMNANVGPMVGRKFNIKSAVTPSTLSAIAKAAGSVADAALNGMGMTRKNKKNGGSRKDKKDRKASRKASRKSGGSRKDKKDMKDKKDKKDGGFLSMF